jgi:hypothetical protein
MAAIGSSNVGFQVREALHPTWASVRSNPMAMGVGGWVGLGFDALFDLVFCISVRASRVVS